MESNKPSVLHNETFLCARGVRERKISLSFSTRKGKTETFVCCHDGMLVWLLAASHRAEKQSCRDRVSQLCSWNGGIKRVAETL